MTKTTLRLRVLDAQINANRAEWLCDQNVFLNRAAELLAELAAR